MDVTSMRRVRREPAQFMLVLGVILTAASVWALDVPPLTGRVVDLAHVLPADVAASLTSDLEAHEAKTGNQVAVLILPSLDGEPLEEFSHRVATTWKLGQKGTDNGVLFLIALRDRKVRIEVGYGLEGTLTDVRSVHIIRNEIVPRFRAGDYPGGINAGVEAILNTIEGTYTAPERHTAPALAEGSIPRLVIAVIIGVVFGLALAQVNRILGPLVGGGLALFLAPWLVPALGAAVVTLLLVTVLGSVLRGSTDGVWRGRQPRDDGFWYSSGSGGFGGGSFGGGFSGGGGSFGGGGASGDW
jgi:uncharacterized protein